MNHNLALDFSEGRTRARPVEGRLIVAAAQICRHELHPAAAATRHLAASKEHIVGDEGGFGSRSEAEHRTAMSPSRCRCNSL